MKVLKKGNLQNVFPMKVLKKGNLQNVFPMKVKCRRVVDQYGFAYGKEPDFCGSELEVDAIDIKKHPWFKYPDYKGVDYCVICPVCGQFVVINSNDIPMSIRENAKEIWVD